QFGNRYQAEVAVGGPAGSLADLTSVTRSRIWLDVAVLAIAIVLVLGLATRALLLPLVATVFGLLVAACSFGVLQLLFGGVNPPLGGPGYLDPMSIIGIFTIVFGVTVTWAAVLLMEMREAFVSSGREREAVTAGLRETAAPVTGAGLLMVAALVPFTATSLLNIRAFGIGVAVAILLDTVVVRPVLLPAAVAVLGRHGWWPTTGPGVHTRTTGVIRPALARPVETPIGAPR
ncbi:MAG: MMPL family transporter, partial [Solirubrobacteraceae bacterium]